MTLIVDGTNKPLGRLASEVAQLLKKGYPVVIVNAEKIVVSGTMEGVLPKFKRRYDLRTLSNPIKQTPRWPRTPEGIVRKTIAGMIHRDDRTKLLKRLKVFRGEPPVEGKRIDLKLRTPSRFVYIQDIARALGGVE
ncbi:MAG: 50S ribosomal protein L13 [Candidatus Diapherotrites archaeon]|nr:50S ribosomal protein L13 [Candidatus Diapherotrites archaeon]